jgi:hypothetical protein
MIERWIIILGMMLGAAIFGVGVLAGSQIDLRGLRACLLHEQSGPVSPTTQ